MPNFPTPPGFVPIVGNIIGDGEVVPRPTLDSRPLEGLGCSDQQLHDRMMKTCPPIPWTRKIEVTLDEAEITGLNLFIKGYFKATRERLTEEEALRVLVVDGLVGMGDLPIDSRR